MLELVSPTTAPRSAEIGPDVPLKSRGATLRRESMKNWSALLVVGCTMEKWHLIDCPVQLPKDSITCTDWGIIRYEAVISESRDHNVNCQLLQIEGILEAWH